MSDAGSLCRVRLHHGPCVCCVCVEDVEKVEVRFTALKQRLWESSGGVCDGHESPTRDDSTLIARAWSRIWAPSS